MLCAISNSVPEQPVVSVKSGHVFERSLIEKYLKEYGKCPITSQDLTQDDLVTVLSGKSIKPRHTPATSIPGLIGLLHNEYDALMLEALELRTQLGRSRQELAHALYQHDASCRVIARLTRDRDAALTTVTDLKAQLDSSSAASRADAAAAAGAAAAQPRPNGAQAADEPDAKRAKGGITPEIVAALDAKNTALFDARKALASAPPPAGLAAPTDLQALTLSATQPLHSTTSGGVLALALAPAGAPNAPATFVATGGVDHSVQIFDLSAGRISASLTGHTKKVTTVAYATEARLLSGSADKTVKVWDAAEGGAWGLRLTLRDFATPVVQVCVHPVSRYAVTVCSGAAWYMHDLESGEMITRDLGGKEQGSYLCGAIHPDGAFLGVGSSLGMLRIFDLKSNAVITDLNEGEGEVHAIAFNENGYWAAISKGSGVQVWDLRKLRLVVEVQPFENAAVTKCLSWDHSGKYLACGGPELKVYEVVAQKGKKGQKGATASVVKTLVDLPGSKGAYCLQFGALAKSLYVGASDHNLRSFSC